ncbi:MAG: ATP-binding protein, partial [Ignavibacteriae bacterium]|nr:ATP-binding protein [Ignavibacteriota bacterium]
MVLDIIKQQKLELERKLTEKYIPRESKFIEPDSDLIKVIIGPRRAGKSFFTIHSLKNKFNFGYANFDDERL